MGAWTELIFYVLASYSLLLLQWPHVQFLHIYKNGSHPFGRLFVIISLALKSHNLLHQRKLKNIKETDKKKTEFVNLVPGILMNCMTLYLP